MATNLCIITPMAHIFLRFLPSSIMCVPQFKEAISAKFSGAPVENLCLIFAGKIMKDHESLSSHNVKVQARHA